jgi:16S rRNA (cytidine1402-2'-O)-methyltransferase
LVKALEQFAEHFGPDRNVSVSRELSKVFEENKRGTIAEVLAHFQSKTIKGEIVIVVEGKPNLKMVETEEDPE